MPRTAKLVYQAKKTSQKGSGRHRSTFTSYSTHDVEDDDDGDPRDPGSTSSLTGTSNRHLDVATSRMVTQIVGTRGDRRRRQTLRFDVEDGETAPALSFPTLNTDDTQGLDDDIPYLRPGWYASDDDDDVNIVGNVFAPVGLNQEQDIRQEEADDASDAVSIPPCNMYDSI